MALAHQQDSEAAPERILVLDDDPEICELTQAYLQQQGFAVDTVQSGEALNACLLYTSPSPRDLRKSRMPSSA